MPPLPKIPAVIRDQKTGKFVRNPDYGQQSLSSDNANDNSGTPPSAPRNVADRVIRGPGGKFMKNPDYVPAPTDYQSAYQGRVPNAPAPAAAPKNNAPPTNYTAAYNTMTTAALAKAAVQGPKVNRTQTMNSLVLAAVNKVYRQLVTLTAVVRQQTTILALGNKAILNVVTQGFAAIHQQNQKANQPQVRTPTAPGGAVAQTASKIEVPFEGVLKGALALGLLFAAVNDKIVQIVAQVAAFIDIGKKIGSAIGRVVEMFKEMISGGGWLSKLGPMFEAIGNGFKWIWKFIAPIADVIGAILKPLALVARVLGKIMSFIPGLNVVIALLSLKMKDITDLFEDLYDAFKDIFSGNILKGLEKAIDAFNTFVVRIIGRFLQDLLDLLGFEETAKALEKFLDDFNWDQVFADIKKFFMETLPDTLKKWYQASLSWIEDTVVKPLKNALEWVGNFFTNMVDTVKKWWTDLDAWTIEHIDKPLKNMLDSITSFFDKLFTDPMKALSDLVGFDPVKIVSDWFDGVKTWMKDAFDTAVDKLKNNLINIDQIVKGLFDSIKSSLINMFPDTTVLGINPRKTVEAIIGKPNASVVTPPSQELSPQTRELGDRSAAAQRIAPNIIVQNNNSSPTVTNVSQNGGGARYGAPPTSYSEPSLLRTYN